MGMAGPCCGILSSSALLVRNYLPDQRLAALSVIKLNTYGFRLCDRLRVLRLTANWRAGQ